MLRRYGDWKKQNAMVILVVLISWYFSLLTVFVLPLDVSSTINRQCQQNEAANKNNSATPDCKQPWIYVYSSVLSRFWRIVYWSSQFLTWILLPLMQSYSKAGDFTFYEKFKSAVKDNILYYGSYLVICIIFLIYIILHTGQPLDGQKLKAIASSASNTWGLFLLIVLLGYALVDVPRKLWFSGNPEMCLQRSYFQLSKLCSDFEDAEMELKDIIQKIYITESQMKAEDILMPYMRKIVSIIPVQFQKTMLKYQIKPNDSIGLQPSIATLIHHHKQLKKAIHTYRRNDIQRMRMYDKVYTLQRIVADRKGELQKFKDFSLIGPYRFSERWRTFIYEYWWQAVIRPIFMKMLSILSGILSVAVIWSEVTFFNREPVLSIFALITYYVRDHYNYLLMELMCALVLAYLCYCAYSTVFKIRLFNYYNFAPEHQTDEYSLIFSGMLLSRLTPPLCLNFLGLIHMDSHIIKSRIMETQYTQIMGHMDVINIISNGFNIYFPMVMLIFSVTTYFNVGSIILSAIGFQQYVADSEITEDTIANGQRRAAAEKERRHRKGLLAHDELQCQYSSSIDTPPVINSNLSRRDMLNQEEASAAATTINSCSFEMDIGNMINDPKPNNNFQVPSRNIFDDI